MNDGSYHHLLSAIYDLVLTPGDWPIVLRLLAEALNSPYAASVITTPERDTPHSLGVVGMTVDDHRAFLRAWHKRNVFGARRPVREAGAIVLGRTILPKSALQRTAMYQEYLAKRFCVSTFSVTPVAANRSRSPGPGRRVPSHRTSSPSPAP